MKQRLGIKYIRNKNFWILGLIMIFGIAGHYYLSDFTKAIETYPDELRYYTIARSIYMGEGIKIRGIDNSFQKIAYSLLLVPFFSIKNVLLRIKAISLANCIITMSSIIPVWFIGKETKLEYKYRYILIALVVIWPELMISMTFMSEVLYWPIFLSFLYLWMKHEIQKKKLTAFLMAVICYIGYLTKEIFLALFLSYIIFDLFCIAYYFCFNKKDVNKDDVKKRIISFVVFVSVFVGIHLFMKISLFRGLANSYDQMGISAILAPYNFMYMFYAFFYYLAAVFIAVWILPMLYPVIYFHYLSGLNKKFLIFINLFFVIASATIAYTISIREDLGRTIPRVHLRYLGPGFIIVFCLFLHAVSVLNKKNQREICQKAFLILALATLFACLVFKGVARASAVDQYTLESYVDAGIKFANLLPPENGEKVFYTGVFLIHLFMIGVVTASHMLFQKKDKRLGMIFFLVSVSAFYVTSNTDAFHFVKSAYAADVKAVHEVIVIDNFLDQEKTDDMSVIYFTDCKTISKLSKYMDTYMDHTSGFYYVDDSFLDTAELKNGLHVRDLAFREHIWDGVYEPVDTVDYIILENTVNKGILPFADVEKLESISGDFYSVYKNTIPERITVKQTE